MKDKKHLGALVCTYNCLYSQLVTYCTSLSVWSRIYIASSYNHFHLARMSEQNERGKA